MRRVQCCRDTGIILYLMNPYKWYAKIGGRQWQRACKRVPLPHFPPPLSLCTQYSSQYMDRPAHVGVTVSRFVNLCLRRYIYGGSKQADQYSGKYVFAGETRAFILRLIDLTCDSYSYGCSQ